MSVELVLIGLVAAFGALLLLALVGDLIPPFGRWLERRLGDGDSSR